LPLSSNGSVFINDTPAPIVGKISMDLTTIDVSDVPEHKIFLGQQVEILGLNSTIDKLANLSKTIAYEILTGLGNRFEKIYT